MRYVFKHASTVSPNEERQIKKLRLDTGTIWDDFTDKKRHKRTHVVLGWDGDKIVAWGLIYWDRIQKQWDFSVYVKRKWRRRKIGTRIYNKTKKTLGLKNGQIEVHRHDTGSMMFFNKLQSKR